MIVTVLTFSVVEKMYPFWTGFPLESKRFAVAARKLHEGLTAEPNTPWTACMSFLT